MSPGKKKYVLNVEILGISLRIARIKKKVGMKIKKLKKVKWEKLKKIEKNYFIYLFFFKDIFKKILIIFCMFFQFTETFFTFLLSR